MKKSSLSVLSLLLAIIMLLGSLAACTGGGNVNKETTDTTPSNTTENTDSDGGEESESKENGGSEESDPPSISGIDNGLLIENANALANGVNAYFVNGKRTEFVLENQNMKLEYALAAHYDQQISYLESKTGNTYIENTADVFVRMTNGNVFYSSGSNKPATANLYRFGYYMYEARFEEQNFMGSPFSEGAIDLSLKSIERNQVKVTGNDDDSIKATVTNVTDPYILFSGVDHVAEDYPYLQITLKAHTKSTRGIAIYVGTEEKSLSQATTVLVSPSEEYVTYTIPLFRTSWYEGKVNQLRLDFATEASSKGEVYDIKSVKFMKGNVEGTPESLGLNRSFFVYSDKFHHVVQVATDGIATEGIASIGMETKIAKSKVSKVVVKDKDGVHNSFEGVDWNTAEYVGFDITDAGIFGYILPAGELTDKLEVIESGDNYVIVQSRTPENNTLQPSGVYNSETKRYDALVDNNANDFFMGQRIYTDESHDFTAFLEEAYCERNPLAKENFIISKRESSYESTFTCPECGFKSEENMLKCSECRKDVSFIENANMYFKEYDALRGIYTFWVPSESFSAPYHQYPNKYVNLTFKITGDDHDRKLYLMTASGSGCLECAALLDEDKMMLPVPVEVGKNFSEGYGERNLWNIQDSTYGEALVPMVIKKGSDDKYTFLNLYQNWGQQPLKQVSWIQFYAPYYHLSTGVTETNCIVPYYSCKNARGLGTLPDHRAMSAHLWAGQPQHTSGGSHRWLIYTDAEGNYSASENTLDYIDSYGPVYADVYMDYLSDDGKIKVSYTHTEFPQTDENRAFYEMKYEVLGDLSFTDFSRDFCFYDVTDNDAVGSYVSVGYLNENNENVIVDAAKGDESFKYTLGTECPYFSFFNMPDYDRNSSSAEGFTNLSFLIYNYELTINGERSDARFAIVNEDNRIRLSLDLGETKLKAGDSFVINAIVMPWGDENLDYSTVGDKNVRDVRVNSLLNPLTPSAVENCEILESTFVPKIKSTNGKNATFTLKGGQNNVAVRVYGLHKLTVPKIEELVEGEWVEYRVSSAYKPDRFGNGHYFDGYSVHYDADGTFSYAFIVPMDYTDADGRTFRVSATEDFKGWPRDLPEIDQGDAELPMNVFVNASEIFNNAKSEAGKNLGGVAMSSDGTFVTLSSNAEAVEAYFHLWYGDGGKTVTGQYLVMKYRLPSTNNKKYTYNEFFTTTTPGASATGNCFSISNAFINDDQWHTLVIDLSTWGKDNFKADENGEFKVQFVRFDVFNNHYENDNSIDIEFFGISDSLEEIRAYYSVDSIQVLTEKNKITSYDKSGNVIDTPTDSAPSQGGSGEMTDAVSGVPGFNVYIDPAKLNSTGKNTIWKDCVAVSGDGSFTTFKNYVNAASSDHQKESYFNFYSSNGNSATGQYAVIKYRANVQQGSITLWSSTQNPGAAAGNSVDLNGPDSNGLFVADNQWHIVVVDLSKLIPTYTAAKNGKFAATHLRVDFFNFGKPRDPADTQAQVDVAYVGLCDDYTEIVCSDKSVSELVFYNGKTYKYSTETGEITESPEDAPIPEPTPTPDASAFNKYYNATSIIQAAQNSSGHVGDEELIENSDVARIYNCVDPAANKNSRLESYFTLLTGNTEVTGQYLVLKYRANLQVGCIQVYTSTQNASASEAGTFYVQKSNGLFIADGEWHIAIVDLAKATKSFTANSAGDYVATHLRIDLFNFDNPRDDSETAYVDLAYVGLCDNFTKILGSDTSVEKAVFYDGSLKEYYTATGSLVGNPNFIINSAALAGQTERSGLTYAASADGTYVTYTQTVGAPEGFAYAVYPNANINVPTEATGQFVMIKYRTSYTGEWQMYIGANNGSLTAQGGKDSFSLGQKNGNTGAMVSDGEWQYLVIDVPTLFDCFSVKGGYSPEDGTEDTYILDYFRIDYFNEKSEVANTVDVAYIAIADSVDKLVNYAQCDSYTYVDTYVSGTGITNETVSK